VSTTLERPTERRTVRSRARTRWWLYLPALVVVLVAILGPVLAPFDPEGIVGRPSTAPGGEFWFGTDTNGMDVFSRVLAATRTNLLVALAATVVATAIAVVVGLVAGVNEAHRGVRGLIGRGLARFLDITDAVPSVIIGLVLVALFGASVPTIIAALVVVAFPRQAKLVRAEVLKVRSDPFVDSARMAGSSEPVVMFGTVLPNSVGPALENMSAVFGVSIIVEAALGFLGVGLPPPTPEWGTMIATGAADALNLRWWGAAFPTAALIFTVSAIATAGGEFLRPRR
jgi:peptide/nickel transport system permease protein